MKKIKFIINAMTPKIAILILASILIFLAAESISWFLPLIFSRILDTILDKEFPSLLLFFFAMLTAISIGVTSAMSYINSKLLLKSHKNMVNFLLERTFNQLSEARDKKGVNYYSNLILKTSNKALNLFDLNALTHFFRLITLTVISIIIFCIDMHCGIATLFLTLIAIIIHRYNTPYYIKNSEKLSGQKLELFGWLGDALRGSWTIRQFNAVEHETALLDKRTRSLFKSEGRLNVVDTVAVWIGFDFFKNAYLLFIIVYSLIKVTTGAFPISLAVALMMYSNMLVVPIRQINAALEQFATSWAAVSLLENEYRSNIIEQGIIVNDIQTIEFKHVSLTLDNKTILDNISFKIEKGGHYRIAGKSGVGKSCMIKLLLGYFQDYTGEIVINGISIRDINAQSVYAQMSVLMQNSVLFNCSIEENILFSDAYKKNDVKSICEKFNLIDTSIHLDSVYADNLSGGEKNRVLLARALCHEKPFLILDEPLEGVDEKTKGNIYAYLSDYINTKTLILITHDESLANLTSETLFIS
ncbi:MAG: ABC transporter ATP-binding protein/permease [Treponema sp.]|jgi:ABC-type multidrug transport system fused ATPase/permease subunit|nr:ABC transporter ATP-binding protein/permease [Treponema sp.]